MSNWLRAASLEPVCLPFPLTSSLGPINISAAVCASCRTPARGGEKPQEIVNERLWTRRLDVPFKSVKSHHKTDHREARNLLLFHREMGCTCSEHQLPTRATHFLFVRQFPLNSVSMEASTSSKSGDVSKERRYSGMWGATR